MTFQSNSPLFQQSMTYKPFSYDWAVDITTEHENMHWIEREIDLSDDVTEWKSGALKGHEMNHIKQILRLFTQSDVNVGTFYYDLLIPMVRNNEVRNMLGSFAVREGTHQRAYSLLNETLGFPDSDYSIFMEYAEMRDKHEYMLDADPSTEKGFALTLAKSVFNEGVSLFASFAMLMTYQRRGLMKGMGKVVEWSTKDETKHVEGICAVFKAFTAEHGHIVNDELKKAIYDMAREVIELEDKFIDLAFEMGNIEGLTADETKQYIRFIADRRLVQLGLKPNWNIDKNPLPWMEWLLSAADRTKFFENKVANYEVVGLAGEWDYSEPKRFMVYTKQGCRYCVTAKSTLRQLGHEYSEIDLSDDALRAAFYDRNELQGAARTMPQVFEVDDKGQVLAYVGGSDDLTRYLTVARAPDA